MGLAPGLVCAVERGHSKTGSHKNRHTQASGAQLELDLGLISAPPNKHLSGCRVAVSLFGQFQAFSASPEARVSGRKAPVAGIGSPAHTKLD